MNGIAVIRVSLGLLLLTAAVACKQPSHLDEPAIRANNRGVAAMGRFDYRSAAEIFAALTQEHPRNDDLRLNWAIARLNQQSPDDLTAAWVAVQHVLAHDPDNLRAHYLAGILTLYQGTADAAPHFQRVVEADAHDAYAHYFLGQSLAQRGNPASALASYQRAAELDPLLRSAFYGAFLALRGLGRDAEATLQLQQYQRLEGNPQARLAEIKYTRMGPKAEALVLGGTTAALDLPRGALFADPSALLAVNPAWRPLDDARPASVTAADIDGDARLDLFLARGLADEAKPNAVLLGNADGTFRLQHEHPLANVVDVNAALWGDYDNDGRTDVYLCRRGPNQLWHNTQAGWVDVTANANIDGGPYDTQDGLFFDADHDGDLDLLLANVDGPTLLYTNNLDGTFRAPAADSPWAADSRPATGLVSSDLDGDRDVDIMVLHATPPHDVWRNDRLWAYESFAGFERMRNEPLRTAVAGDSDADGRVEFFALDNDGRVLRWRSDETGSWTATTLAELGANDMTRLALADFDGDGRDEVLVSGATSWRLYDIGDGSERTRSQDDVSAMASVVTLDPSKGPALITLREDGTPQILQPGPGRHTFVGLSLRGRIDLAETIRSNASGIGAKLAVRFGSRWYTSTTLRRDSGPGQSLQQLTIGLGGATKLDFVRIEWSDGVLQTEIDLAAGDLHVVSETQRQLSSCPVLFTWTGQSYEFVTDLLGVGGIGYATAPGEYAEPRPRESLLLPASKLRAHGGRYRLKIAEPMEEISYIDAAFLTEYVLPAGWQMALDERMGILGPEPTGRPFFYRNEVLALAATNERREEVTQTILRVDGQAAPPGQLDGRFIGRLAGTHQLTLRFADPLDVHPGEPWLIADGWVEYPYSQTTFAAWQANASFSAPTLEARVPGGDWQVVLEQFGYPAGMPRRMAVPLERLPRGTQELRLSTNYEIYWDRLAVAFAEPAPELTARRRPLRRAQLAESGFARRTTGPQRLPHYDDGVRLPLWDTRHARGFYSELGDVLPLLERSDDAVAILGPGEELRLEFAADEEAIPVGATRWFVLDARGWAKDLDLFTKDGDSVDPLPMKGASSLRRDALHARFNTRYRSGW